jgi:hypothetical protein
MHEYGCVQMLFNDVVQSYFFVNFLIFMATFFLHFGAYLLRQKARSKWCGLKGLPGWG